MWRWMVVKMGLLFENKQPMYHQLRWWLLSFDKSLNGFKILENVHGEKPVGIVNSWMRTWFIDICLDTSIYPNGYTTLICKLPGTDSPTTVLPNLAWLSVLFKLIDSLSPRLKQSDPTRREIMRSTRLIPPRWWGRRFCLYDGTIEILLRTSIR